MLNISTIFKDINECLDDFLLCAGSPSEPICVNTRGSYYCSFCRNQGPGSRMGQYYQRRDCCRISKCKIKSSLYSLNCAKECNELKGPSPCCTAHGHHTIVFFEEISCWWQAIGNIASNLTTSRFELRTSRARKKRAIALPKSRYQLVHRIKQQRR